MKRISGQHRFRRKGSVVLAVLLLVFSLLPVGRASAAIEVVKSGDSSNFAKDAPIATVTIDKSKISLDNLVLTQSGKLPQSIYESYSGRTFEIGETGYVQMSGVPMKEDYSTLGSFSFIYKDAAVMSDGTRKNLEVIFQNVSPIGKKGNGAYTDTLYFARPVARRSEAGNVPSIIPRSLHQETTSDGTIYGKHFGLRTDVMIRIGSAGAVTGDETFLFTANDINVARPNDNFKDIVYASANENWSEWMEPAFGLDGESAFYVPQNSALIRKDGKLSSGQSVAGGTAEGYNNRFVGSTDQTAPIDYNYGFAATAKASGFVVRMGSSGGQVIWPIEMYILTDGISHMSKSSSGANGKIELWTDGKVDSTTARKLEGGTLAKPRTYDVPTGKVVTYKMTPDAGYELDTLTVNNAVSIAYTTVYNSAGTAVDHYEYTFPGTIANDNDQSIQVTWKRAPVVPKTGDSDSPALWALLAVLALAGCSAFLLGGGKKYSRENVQ